MVALAVGFGESAEGRLPIRTLVKTVRVVEGMTGFVSQEAHDVALRFHARCRFVFQLREPGIGQIERNPDASGPVRTSPLVRQVYRGPEPEPLGRELVVQLRDHRLDGRTAERQSKLGNAPSEQGVTG